jgi:hypothetical protein
MELQHPFAFFIKFVELNLLEEYKSEFFKYPELEFSLEEEWINRVEFDDTNEGGYVVTVYFKEHILQVLKTAKADALIQLDSILFAEGNLKEVSKRLAILSATWSETLLKAGKSKELKKYKLFEVFEDIKLEIDSKKGLIETIGKPSNYSTSNNFEKIKWTGQKNQLVSLFYDLLSDDLIQTNTKANLEQFIVSSFVDSDGHEFSKTSIKTVLTPSKMEKRTSGNKRTDVKKYKE